MEGTRLTLARKMRGFSKKELAELVEVTPKSIADYENDITNPSTEIEQRLIRALRFPEAFFNLHTTEPMSEEAISFRARTKLKRSQKTLQPPRQRLQRNYPTGATPSSTYQKQTSPP